jgi:hypothetical protein
MKGMSFTETAVLLELKLLRRQSFILRRRVIAPLALGTPKGDDISHTCYLYTLMIMVSRIIAFSPDLCVTVELKNAHIYRICCAFSFPLFLDLGRKF